MEVEQQEKECPASRVLVVDDEPLIRELLVDIAVELGFKCHEVKNATEALVKIKENQFHCIFIDQVMPDMTGSELIGKIKELQLPYKPNIKIVSGHDGCLSN